MVFHHVVHPHLSWFMVGKPRLFVGLLAKLLEITPISLRDTTGQYNLSIGHGFSPENHWEA